MSKENTIDVHTQYNKDFDKSYQQMTELSQESSATLDIGNYIDKRLDNFTLKKLLQHPWTPTKNYEFPYSIHNKQGKEEKRFAAQKYLDKHDWLGFSNLKQGY